MRGQNVLGTVPIVPFDVIVEDERLRYQLAVNEESMYRCSQNHASFPITFLMGMNCEYPLQFPSPLHLLLRISPIINLKYKLDKLYSTHRRRRQL